MEGWVLQPDLFLSAATGTLEIGALELPRTWIAAGAWANVELGSAAATEAADRGEPGVGIWSPWLQLGFRAGDLSAALQWVGYLHPADRPPPPGPAAARPPSRDGAFDTHELGLDLRIEGDRVIPHLTWWRDLDRLDGSYLETGLALRLPLLPLDLAEPPVSPLFSSLRLDVTAGWSLGQHGDPTVPVRPANFGAAGFTHLELDASTRALVAGRLAVAPGVRLQLRRPAAVGVADDDEVRIWFTLALTPVRILALGEERR